MSSRPPERLRHTLGLRLAVWYCAIFVASSLALIALTYLLLSASLRAIRSRDYPDDARRVRAQRTAQGGVDGLADAIRPSQAAAGYEPLFVRTVGPFRDLVFLSPKTSGSSSISRSWRRRP